MIENVSQGSTVATEIATDISEVNQAANKMSKSSSQIHLSSKDLNNLADQEILSMASTSTKQFLFGEILCYNIQTTQRKSRLGR